MLLVTILNVTERFGLAKLSLVAARINQDPANFRVAAVGPVKLGYYSGLLVHKYMHRNGLHRGVKGARAGVGVHFAWGSSTIWGG